MGDPKRNRGRAIIIALVIVALSWAWISNAHASLSDDIGIILSDTCLTMIENNIESTCPTYEDLLQLDTSNQEWSGSFGVVDGVFQRLDTNVKNSWRLYDHENVARVFVDPPGGQLDKIRMITIHPNFDTYLLPQTMFVDDVYGNVVYDINENKTATVWEITEPAHRTVYHDRFVDTQCKKSTINADKWTMLVADTVYYMRNGCGDKYTSFNHVEKIYDEKTEFDITETRKWQHETWIESVKQFCIFKFRAC